MLLKIPHNTYVYEDAWHIEDLCGRLLLQDVSVELDAIFVPLDGVQSCAFEIVSAVKRY